MSNRIDRYKKAKQDRIEGKYNGAPLFYSFPRLGELVPVIPKGKQMMFLGGSGVGKSQSWVGMVLLPVYQLIKTKGYKARFHIFLLEDPIELLEDRLFCRVLYIQSSKKHEIDPMELNSMRKNPVSDEIEALFDKVDKIVEDILSYCTIHDSIYNATGVYKTLRTASGKQGEHVWEDREFTYNKSDKSTYTKTVQVYKEYITQDEEMHNIVICDNLNNLSEEYDKKAQRQLSIRECIGRWCRDYARLQITKHWNWTVINIMQTSLDTDRKQFNLMGGEQVVAKVEPNLSNLGDNKMVARDHHLVLGLFSPARFGIEEYEDYDITQLDDNFRAVIILKSNFSISNRKLPLLFKGACSYYEELPLPGKIDYTKYSSD